MQATTIGLRSFHHHQQSRACCPRGMTPAGDFASLVRKQTMLPRGLGEPVVVYSLSHSTLQTAAIYYLSTKYRHFGPLANGHINSKLQPWHDISWLTLCCRSITLPSTHPTGRVQLHTSESTSKTRPDQTPTSAVRLLDAPASITFQSSLPDINTSVAGRPVRSLPF